MSWWCKGSTLSRHVRGLGFDSRVRTLFSIDLCCIYLVFTMLFIFVKRMYSKAWCSVHGLVPYSFLTLIGRAPPALHLRSHNIVHLCVLMHEKHRCPGGVEIARFPGMSEVSGLIPVSGHCFLLIFVGFTLCLPCYSSFLSSCTVKRGAASTARALLISNLNRTSPTSITP